MKDFRTKIEMILRLYFNLCVNISMISLVLMMLVVVLDVAKRHVFGRPLFGSYDAVEILMVSTIFFAFAGVIFDRKEISIDLIDGIVPDRFVKFLVSFSGFASAAIILFIVWSMIGPALDAYKYGDLRLELNVPVWVIWAFALFALFGAVISAIAVVFQIGAKHVDDTSEIKGSFE